MMENHGLLQILEELGKDAPVVKNIGITHLYELMLYISADEKFFL